MVERLSCESRYALDTEFHGERTYYPKLALVQIAWTGGIALIDPLAVDVAPIARLLGSDATMVAHACEQDLAILERHCGRGPAALFDTQVAAGFVGLGTPALARLCEEILHVQLAKGDRLTDWTRRPLNKGQRAYAAADVEHLLALHDQLAEQLAERGRTDWAADEMNDRLERDRSAQDPDCAWWKIKGSRSLRGKHQRVAQTVSAWRERTAAQRDLPPRFVLSDLALSGIVHRAPTSEAELRAIRGIDKSNLRDDWAAEVLDAVRAGIELDAAAVVRPPAAPGNERRYQAAVALIGAWLNSRARDLGVESSLLGTRADLTELIVHRTGKLSSGWRADVAGEPIRHLLAGEMCLVLRNGGTKLALEAHEPSVDDETD